MDGDIDSEEVSALNVTFLKDKDIGSEEIIASNKSLECSEVGEMDAMNSTMVSDQVTSFRRVLDSTSSIEHDYSTSQSLSASASGISKYKSVFFSGFPVGFAGLFPGLRAI